MVRYRFVWPVLYVVLSLSLLRCSARQPLMRIAVVSHSNGTKGDIFHNPTHYNHTVYPSKSVLSYQSFFRGTALWANMINGYGGIPTYDSADTRVRVELSYFNIGTTSEVARAQQLANKLINGTYGKFDVIIAPGFSLDDIVTIFLSACETSKTCLTIVPLSPSSALFVCTEPLPDECKRDGSRRFQYGFSVLYDGNFALSAHLSLFRQHSITRVGMLYSSLPYGTLSSATTSDTAFSLGMTIAISKMFDHSIPWSSQNATAVAIQLRDADVQGLCILSNGADSVALESLVKLIRAFKEINWLPAAIALGGSIGSSLQSRLAPIDFAYMLTAAQWDWHLKGRQYQTINSTFNLELFPATLSDPSPAVFRNEMIRVWGQISDANLVYANDAVQALTFIQKFIEVGNGAWDVESMRSVSRQLSVPSINGQLQIDAYGRTVVSDQLVFQTLPNGQRLINSPLSIGVPPVIPMPRFDEREFHGKFFESSLEQSAIAMNSVLFIYSTVLMLGIMLFRKHQVMKAATPLFCVLMILGSQLIQVSVYLTSLYQTSDSCHAQFWLLTVGFSLMFGALFMKTWRVVKIFNAGKNLKKVAISNSMLLVGLAGLLSFDVILNSVASGTDLFRTALFIVDENRPSLNFYRCAAGNAASIYLIITGVEKAVLIVAGIMLTIAARNVPSRFNETPYLATAIYNCALLGVFAVSIVATGIGGRQVSYAVHVFGIEILVFSTLSIVFIPKFYLMFGNSKRLRELEKLNEQMTNTDSTRTKLGWDRPPAKRDHAAPHTASSIRPQVASQNKSHHSAQPATTAQHANPGSNQRSSFAHSSRMTVMRGPHQSVHAHDHIHQRVNSVHPFNPAGTEMVELHSCDDITNIIPNATTDMLISHSAQLSAQIESITVMLNRIQSELERRQASSLPETIAPIARATSDSSRTIETSLAT